MGARAITGIAALAVDCADPPALAGFWQRADDVHAGGRWQVLRDPEGNESCILGP